jgi:Domain of unknown function (DUF4091)
MPIYRWPLLALALPLLLSFPVPIPKPTLVWWTTHGLEKIRPFSSRPQNAAQEVKIQAARNEFEPFQLVLRAESQNIDSVDISVTDLRGSRGVISSDKYISIYMERYLNLTVPSSLTGGTGEWPDPLVPRVDRYTRQNRNAFPFTLISGRSQPVWIDVYVPPSTPPGSYRGEISVLIGGKSQLKIPLNLEVWNFELPSTSSLVTTFGFSGNSAIRTHYGRYTSDKDVRELTYLYQKAALWHRISMDSNAGVAPQVAVGNEGVKVRWDAYDSVIGPFMDGFVFSTDQPLYGAKATSVAIRTPQLLATEEQRIQFWRQTAEHFRKKGWFDRLFHYVWDEPKPKDYPAMITLGRTVRRADPAVKNLVTAPLDPAWSDFIDIWTPAINCFERKPKHSDFCNPMVERSAYDSEIAKGKRLWWYQACGSHGCFIVGGDYFRGWPDYMIDDTPVQNRIMEWLTWKYHIQGELYFATNESYASKQDPWKDVHLFGGNGDGTMFYPGRPDIIGGTTHIPIESIRLKLIREGLEDYEYLVLLTKLAGYDTVADAVNGFIRKTWDFTQDPMSLYAVREWMGREIEKRQGR